MSANTIMLDRDGYRREEALATAAVVKPGYLLEKTSAGKVKAHATAAGWSQRLVAIEDDLQGKTVSDAYSASALIQYAVVSPGTLCQLMLKSGQNISIGDKLVSNGDGTLKAATGTDKEITAWAEEAVDLSGSGAEDTLIKVRVGP